MTMKKNGKQLKGQVKLDIKADRPKIEKVGKGPNKEEQMKLETDDKVKTKPATKTKVKAKAEPATKTKVKAKAEPATKTKVNEKTKPATKVKVNEDAKPATKVNIKRDSKPDTKVKTGKTSKDNSIPERNVKGGISIVTFQRGNAKIEIDLNKITKATARKLNTIIGFYKKSEIRLMCIDDNEGDYIVYPKRGGGFNLLDLELLEPGFLINAPDEEVYVKLRNRFRNLLKRVNEEDMLEAVEWARYSKEMGIKPPTGWDILDPRWTKTIKIIRVARDLVPFFESYRQLPDTKIVRTILNNIRIEDKETLISFNKKEIKNEVYNSQLINKDGKIKRERVSTVLSQDKGMGLITGHINKDGRGLIIQEVSTIVDCEYAISRVTGYNKKQIESESKLVVYLQDTPAVNNTNVVYNLSTKPGEALKEVTQRMAIALQYPLSYVEWI